MNYFTPELYVQGNSDDEDVLDQTEAAWEKAIKRYRRHYKKIEPHLPPELRKFHDEQCLHDADVFGPARMPLYSLPWNSRDVIIIAQQVNTLFPEFLNTLAILQYAVTAEPVVEVPVKSDVFHPGQPIWLYDEVDLVEPGVFSHEILISDGRVVKIQFREFRYQIAPLVLPGTSGQKEGVPDKAVSA